MCVGGGTTINNGVCLPPPDAVLDRWDERGIDRKELKRAIGEVKAWLPIVQMKENVASKGANAFAAGVEALGLGKATLVDANIAEDCLGCGYCNMGCPFGKKHSMLDTVLPWAQERFDERLDVLPNFRVTRIVHERGRAVGVEGEHGAAGKVILPVGELVVLSAGAIGSSWVLQRSGIGGDAVGRELYFNVNSPLTAEFEQPVDTFAGLQMSHVYTPADPEAGFVLETWFNPVATQALAMPGWFGQHFENMRRYRHMASGGTLVGTTKPASVSATKHGPQIDYSPGSEDLTRLITGLKLLGKVFLAGGARRVMPATHDWQAFGSPEALAGLDAYASSEARGDLLLTTAHPQGGNPVGEPGEGGVVDENFLVRGFANLHVCDASVFPSSVTVNPQLTVMGMAQYAAGKITRKAAGGSAA
jgi:choline dehydrogenase-like flavoprotein